MKRWTLVVVMALSACSQATEERQSKPVGLPLATFTGDVDFAAGTVLIRSDQALGGLAGHSGSLVIPEPGGVTLQNGPSGPWINSSTEHGCGLIPTWGAAIQMTSNYASPAYLGGAYARITNFTGGGANTPCNGVTAPSGIDGGLGNWSYGTFAGTSNLVSWTFNFVSATAFRFSGEVFAAKLSNYNVAAIRGPVKANGDNMAYPTTDGIAFLTSSGTVTSTTNLLGFPCAVAPDPANSRIWYASWQGQVGYTDSAGLDPQSATWTYAGDVGFDVARDASDATVAWLVTSSYGGAFTGALRKVTLGRPPTLSAASTFTGNPGGVATAGTKVYVTNTTENTIDVWATPAMTKTSYDTAVAGCGSPGRIMLRSDGDLWFTAGSAICKMTVAGEVTNVTSATSPTAICDGPDSNLWYGNTAGLVRYIPAEGAPWVVNTYPGFQSGTPASCVSGAAGFWALSSTGEVKAVKFEL